MFNLYEGGYRYITCISRESRRSNRVLVLSLPALTVNTGDTLDT
jgi:hypothetical protein